MRFSLLPPPREVAALTLESAAAGNLPADSEKSPTDSSSLPHQQLENPVDTDFPQRHLFNPKHGWFRRTERTINKFLSAWVFPKIPFMRRSYAVILRRTLTVSEADIGLAGLGGTGMIRALVVSDIHAGPFLSAEALKPTLERLMTLAPDLILLPGDFATVRVEEVEKIVPALSSLRAPLGVFGVLGNHDYYTGDTPRLSQLLAEAGIELLQNRSVLLEKDGARFLLGGVDDLLDGEPRFEDALANRLPGTPTVVMSHNPDVFPEAVRHRVSLVVAGHTHGGQIRIPGLSVLVRMSRYRLDEGRFRYGDSELLVSRGLGVTGLPLRIGCPPEAVLLRLVSARPASDGPSSESSLSVRW